VGCLGAKIVDESEESAEETTLLLLLLLLSSLLCLPSVEMKEEDEDDVCELSMGSEGSRMSLFNTIVFGNSWSIGLVVLGSLK